MTLSPTMQESFDRQRAFTDSGAAELEGSLAIALGRTAGLALLVGRDHLARDYWQQMLHIPSDKAKPLPAELPTFDQFWQKYQEESARYSSFADTSDFSANGRAFANAAGCYAFALDYLRRGKEAISMGGDPKWIGHWGERALTAAGFAAQGAELQRMVTAKASQLSAA